MEGKTKMKGMNQEPTIIDYFIDRNKATPRDLGIIGALEIFDYYLDNSRVLRSAGPIDSDLILRAIRGLNTDEHIVGFLDEYVEKIRRGRYNDRGDHGTDMPSLINVHEGARQDIIFVFKIYAADRKDLQRRWEKIMALWEANINPVNLRQEKG